MRDITKCDCGGYFMTVDSRTIAGGLGRYRRRKCPLCGKIIHTVEVSTENPMSLEEDVIIRNKTWEEVNR